MTFDRIAQLLAAAGNVGVVATLFVALFQLQAMFKQLATMNGQLADAKTVNQTSQYQAALQLMFDWRSKIITDPELADGFRLEPFFRDVFKEVPPKRYFHGIMLFHIFEHYWLLRDREVITEQMWHGWSENLKLLLREKECRFIWEKVKGARTFNPDFVAFVEKTVFRTADGTEHAPRAESGAHLQVSTSA